MYRINIFGTGSRGNSALVSDGETKILIDAGVMPEIIQKESKITEIAAVLLTHEHCDHARHAGYLSSGYSIFIGGTQGTMQEVRGVPCYLSRRLSYGIPTIIGTLTITPFPLSHDAAEPCGFYIKNALGETLVWAYDTGTMEGLEMAQPADCYIIEANYDENIIDRQLENGELPYAGLHGRLTSEFGHLSVQQAAAWLKENADPQSHVIVLSPHPEVLESNRGLFDGFEYVTMPTKFPFLYEFGKKCPF